VVGSLTVPLSQRTAVRPDMRPRCAFRTQHRTRQLATVALALLSFAVVWVVIEGFLRVAGLQVTNWAYNARKYGRFVSYDEIGKFTQQIPHARVFVFGTEMRFNSFGMRDREHAREKPLGTRRLLVLGDSNTLGLGTAFEAIFPQRLQAVLAQRRVEVITGAVSGWNTVAERNY